MKRVVSLSLTLALVLALALTACGGGSGNAGGSDAAPAKTPEELNRAYAEAITAAQNEEERSAFPIIPADDAMYDGILDMIGLSKGDMTASAVVVSIRGIQAYSIIAVMPAEGKDDAVRQALEGYIETQKNNFQFYLEDQYDIASKAKLDTLADGTQLLVMCENQDSVFNAIKEKLGQ